MAFMTRKTVGNKKYLQIVENYREDGKHKQRVLYHVGPYSSLEAAIGDFQDHAEDHVEETYWLFRETARSYAAQLAHLRAAIDKYNVPVSEDEVRRIRDMSPGDRCRAGVGRL